MPKEPPAPNSRPESLRPEARPFEWTALDSTQKEAFRRLTEWLRIAVQDLDALPDNGTDDRGLQFWLDAHRSSRIVMVDGDRGTGKTTALLSFVKACEVYRDGIGKPGQRSYPEDLEPSLALLGRRTVWLEPIDMEPLSPSINLLASILARIEAAAFPEAAAGEWSKQDRSALSDLLRLKTDVALSWHGNVRERASHLDPDAYATEVMHAERARLALNKRLRNLLHQLARNQAGNRAGKENPIFVLPIDDFDLSPSRAVHLLSLLRMMSAPNLFIVVLGSLDMARTAFSLHFTGELLKAAAPATQDGCKNLRIEATADQVAINGLRKLLPPNQRTRLGPMKAKTALDYHPDRRSDNGDRESSEAPSIADLLADVALIDQPLELDKIRALFDGGCSPLGDDGEDDGEPARERVEPPKLYTEIESFRDILNCRRLVLTSERDDPEQRTDRRRSGYSGRAFFRLPPRRVLDLWARLNRIADLDKASKVRQLLNYFGEEALAAVAEDNFLRGDAKELLRGLVPRNWEGDFEIDASYLRFAPPPADPVATLRVPMPFRLPRGTESSLLEFRQVREWTLLADSGGKEGPEFISSGRPLRAVLTLFADHVAMLDRDRLARGSIRPDPYHLGCALARWGLPEAKMDLDVHWPAPDWESIWPFDLLSNAWAEGLRWLSLHPPMPGAPPAWDRKKTPHEADYKALEFLAFIWIATSTALVSRVIPEEIEDLEVPPSESRWKQLVDAVERLVEYVDNPKHPNKRHIHSWLINLACLLSTETGVPWSVAKRFYRRKVMRDFWGRTLNARDIRGHRARALRLDRLLETREGTRIARMFIAPFGVETDPESSEGESQHIHWINSIKGGVLIPQLLWSPSIWQDFDDDKYSVRAETGRTPPIFEIH